MSLQGRSERDETVVEGEVEGGVGCEMVDHIGREREVGEDVCVEVVLGCWHFGVSACGASYLGSYP